ncbi:galactoside O-acetyltransferase [[Clostridium] sordellii]|uniref:acyltransferase n=1 Tax=Paraclostridium sordellii TaxID=1505 RepID=UPI0005E78F45|nr:acyltransferase [Paeniclostridium sordellii]MCR1849941.1 acyltransferase [Paeniclostridium sordellii]CEN76522.1 galactoside O-acetyltransferase [[Clostridium] sordellii] [Paeniclostridium sordellii]
MIELFYRIIKKILIIFHKILNFGLYKNGVILYGIPKLVNRKNINLDHNVRINGNVFIHGDGGVNIGENTTLSYGATIISTGYDVRSWDKNKINKNHKSKSINIGKNVWICANATILPGVNISDEIVVAAGSLVNSDLLESGYIYGGIPAKKLRKFYKG